MLSSCKCLVLFPLLNIMDKKKAAVPLVCHGHSRPVVDLFYSPITPDGFFLISASKGNCFIRFFDLLLYATVASLCLQCQ